ncbi:hypothetical protein [Nocardia aurea]|uniref:Transposase n=1 Tax=Nocardia aurea TaxID=2144174 RepID=A0ABV3FPM8_9NOCA
MKTYPRSGFGSGMTCWRRLRDWQSAGVFEAMHETMLAHCPAAGLIDFDQVIPDGSHVRAKKGAPTPDRVRSVCGGDYTVPYSMSWVAKA